MLVSGMQGPNLESSKFTVSKPANFEPRRVVPEASSGGSKVRPHSSNILTKSSFRLPMRASQSLFRPPRRLASIDRAFYGFLSLITMTESKAQVEMHVLPYLVSSHSPEVRKLRRQKLPVFSTAGLACVSWQTRRLVLREKPPPTEALSSGQDSEVFASEKQCKISLSLSSLCQSMLFRMLNVAVAARNKQSSPCSPHAECLHRKS